jgi:AAA domain/DnaB-like helicase N terminal domain
MTTPGITPHQVEAEQTLLGILMESPQLAENCGVMPGDLFPNAGHPEILGAIMAVYDAKQTCDPILVTHELVRRDQLTRIGTTETHRAGVYLFELVQAAKSPGTIGHYARIVREASARRTLHEIGTRLASVAAREGDLDHVLDDASELAMRLGMVVDTPMEGDSPIPGLSLVTEFVDEPSPPHNWVIPGLLERQDRVILVADEGAGKSVLARQLCTLTAAGRHPFKPTAKIAPRRTLLVDLENPPDLVRRNLRGMIGLVRENGLDLGDRAWRWSKPEGMDLRTAADRQLFTRVIELARPDLIAIGPLYKASMGKATDTYEVAAQELAQVFDQLRHRYGVALWIEHHMPKGDATGHRSGPIGSSYWLRWPEFGPVLKWAGEEESNVYHVKRFRGDRDERCWPDRLIKRAGDWPWTAAWDDAAVENMIFDAVDEEKADSIRAERERREAEDLNRADIAGSGLQHSVPPQDRYWPEKDDEPDSGPSGLSNPSTQMANAGPHWGAGGPGGDGSVPVHPSNGRDELSGSEELPEPPDDHWEEPDGDDPIF